MNITDVLSFLAEERGVDYITKTLNGKVPEGAVNALSLRMKKGKFDNEAMAILKGLQNEEGKDGQKRLQYLSSHASMVYSILRKLKIGDSSFNADEIITDYIKSDKEPSVFWREKYNQANNKPTPLTKEQKRYNTPGLGTARFKDLGDCFVIIPKNYKKIDPEFDFKTNDLEKSHEEMKLLSNQMASKDTSGEKTLGGKKATDNHWCVSASESQWYNSYKINHPNGIFVIIVGKNEDGSPNWNDRNLAFFEPRKLPDGRTMLERLEIANKFDNHINLTDLPQSAQLFIKKMAENNIKRNKPDEFREVQSRLNTTIDERKIKSKESSKAAQALFDYVFEKVREGKTYRANQIISYLKRELKARGWKDYKGLRDLPRFFWSKMGGQSAKIYQQRNNYWLFNWKDIFTFETKTADQMKKKLDEFIANPFLVEKNIDENLKSSKDKRHQFISDKITFSKPTDRMIKSLGGNKKIMDKYFSRREELNKNWERGIVEICSPKSLTNTIEVAFGVGPHNWESGKDPASDDVYARADWSWKYLGKRDDPETLVKLKKFIDEMWEFN